MWELPQKSRLGFGVVAAGSSHHLLPAPGSSMPLSMALSTHVSVFMVALIFSSGFFFFLQVNSLKSLGQLKLRWGFNTCPLLLNSVFFVKFSRGPVLQMKSYLNHTAALITA